MNAGVRALGRQGWFGDAAAFIRQFWKRGKLKVGLGVDAQSLTGATRLYQKAGMHSDQERQISIFEKELRPGEELSTQSIVD
jgi:hypothetical protein